MLFLPSLIFIFPYKYHRFILLTRFQADARSISLFLNAQSKNLISALAYLNIFEDEHFFDRFLTMNSKFSIYHSNTIGIVFEAMHSKSVWFKMHPA